MSLTAVLLFSGFSLGPSALALAGPEELEEASGLEHSIPLDHELPGSIPCIEDPLELPCEDPVPEAPHLLPLCEGAGEDTLVGTVTNTTGAPLDHIRVTAYARSSSSLLLGTLYKRTLTDEQGHYGMELADGNYLVTVVDEQNLTDYQPAFKDNVQVQCGEVEILDFELSGEAEPPQPPPLPGPGIIEANVTEIIEGTDSERPIGSGVALEVSLPNPDSGMACQYPGVLSQGTNAESQVTFNNLLPGHYCVRVTETHWAEGEEQDIEVAADSTTGIQVASFKNGLRDLVGTAEDTLPVDDGDNAETEMPVEEAQVTIEHSFYCPGGVPPSGAEYQCSAETDDEGDYQIDDVRWDDEDYTLKVEHFAYEPYQRDFEMLAPTPTQSTQDEDADLVRSSFSVKGILESDATITFNAVVLHHEDLWDDVWDASEAFSPGVGEFDVDLIWADYHVTIDSTEGTTYRCLTIGPGGRDLGTIDPASGEGSLLDGTLIDNQSSTDAGVEAAVIIESEADEDRCITKSNENGEFPTGLLDGSYNVSFWERDREQLSQVIDIEGEDLVRDFHIDWLTREISGSVRLSELFGTQLRDLAPLLGTVDNALNPVESGVEVICTTDDSQQLKIRTITTDDTTNNLDLELPRNNTYECRVDEGEYFADSQGVNVPRSGNNNFDSLDLILEKRLWEITGTVSDAITGEPLEGARVFEGGGLSPVFQLNTKTNETGGYSFTVEIQEVADGIKAQQIILLVDHVNYVPEIAVIPIGSHPGASGERDFSLIPEALGIPPVPEDPLQGAVNTYCDEEDGLHIHGSDIDGECKEDDGDWTWYPPGGLPPLPPEDS